MVSLLLLPPLVKAAIVAQTAAARAKPDSPFEPTIDLRERFERHINPTFSDKSDKNRSDLYTRARVGLQYTIDPHFSARVEYQYAHDLFWTHLLNASSDASDVLLAFAKYKDKDTTLIVGRQKIELGQQRLLGPTEWLNLSRSFDAGRAQYGPWDIWGGRLGVANTKPETARVGAITHQDPHWGTTSVILKHDLGTVSGIDDQTLDHFVTVGIGKTTLDGEGAVQYGSYNGRDQRAWAFHLRASQDVLPKTSVSVEANSASGGGNATTSRTFDNLYPSNHDLYGLSDLTGWKNMNDLAVKLTTKPFQSLTLQAEAHALSLRDTTDAWYSATGIVNPRPGGAFVDKTGASGRDLGQEVDFQAGYAVSKLGRITGGVAFFEPGHYIQNLSGHSNHYTFGFLQLQLRF